MSLPSVAASVHVGEALLQLPVKGAHIGQELSQDKSDKHVRFVNKGLPIDPETHVNASVSPMAVQTADETFTHEGSLEGKLQPGGRTHDGQETFQVPDWQILLPAFGANTGSQSYIRKSPSFVPVSEAELIEVSVQIGALLQLPKSLHSGQEVSQVPNEHVVLPKFKMKNAGSQSYIR